jgi:hypothetical protein
VPLLVLVIRRSQRQLGVAVQQAGVQPWEELAMIGLHYSWYLGMVFSFLPIWKGLLFVVLSQVGSLIQNVSSLSNQKAESCSTQTLPHLTYCQQHW